MAEGDIGTTAEYLNVYRRGQLAIGTSSPNGAEVLSAETVAFALSAVSAAVARYCGLDIQAADSGGSPSFLEACSGNGSPFVRVTNLPLLNVLSVSIVGADGEETALDSTAYRWDETGTIALVSSSTSLFAAGVDAADSMGFPEGFGNVSVLYEGGVEGGSESPADLRWVVYEMVDERLFGIGVRGTEKKPSVDDLIKRHEYRLNPFRRVVM